MEMFNTISLLVEAFNAHGLKYHLSETEQYQEIHVPFGIRNGPFVDMRFISSNRGNDTSVRIMNLVNKVPEERRFRVLEACNTMNCKYRFLKFNMDKDNDVHVEYDLPVNTGNECLGEMAFEIFLRTMQILNEGYITIARALYMPDGETAEPKTEAEGARDILKLLKDDHDEINIKISKTPPEDKKE